MNSWQCFAFCTSMPVACHAPCSAFSYISYALMRTTTLDAWRFADAAFRPCPHTFFTCHAGSMEHGAPQIVNRVCDLHIYMYVYIFIYTYIHLLGESVDTLCLAFLAIFGWSHWNTQSQAQLFISFIMRTTGYINVSISSEEMRQRLYIYIYADSWHICCKLCER